MGSIVFSKYQYRFLARLIVECATPLSIGSGEIELDTDASVAQDANGLPYIPGTSLAGVVRSFMGKTEADEFFGNQTIEGGKGSEVRFTDGRVLNSSSIIIDGLCPDASKDALLEVYAALPLRQHVRISHRGTAVNTGKFDEEIVYTGTRFCFEIEVSAKKNDTSIFDKILDTFLNDGFRIGSGSRNGFGALKVVDAKKAILDLSRKDDLRDYLDKSSELQESGEWNGWAKLDKEVNSYDFHKYSIELEPQGFFIFGSGLPSINGNETDPNISPVKERVIKWDDDGKGYLSVDYVLIPGTSVKGAVRHRTAYHYNKLTGVFADIFDIKSGKLEADAVSELFGRAETGSISRGKVLFHDVYLMPEKGTGKNLSHIKIDKITGGVCGSSFFFEEVTDPAGSVYHCDILVEKDALSDDTLRTAFERAISDICNGLLPLGGAVNRGNGMFKGSYTII